MFEDAAWWMAVLIILGGLLLVEDVDCDVGVDCDV